MTSHEDNVTHSNAPEQLTGRVKWFNNKAGYGFITVTDGTRSGSDIFVHHSAINVENQQYKYLIQGEYVQFDLVKTASQTHEWQASNVAGINAGKLMCETRHELKVARNEYKSSRQPEEQAAEPVAPKQRAPRQTNAPAPRARREGPKEASGNRKEWTMVTNKSQRGPGRPPRHSTNNSSNQ